MHLRSQIFKLTRKPSYSSRLYKSWLAKVFTNCKSNCKSTPFYLFGTGCLTLALFSAEFQNSCTLEKLSNWSENHFCQPRTIYTPESINDVHKIINDHNKANRRIRCIGSGLSPNGLAFVADGEDMINLALCDKILEIDEERKQVTVESGVLVDSLLRYLKEYGLTLQNVASIREQQIGGLTQAGCHGTGVSIPPMEEQIISMELVTPGLGTLTLSKVENPKLFSLAKCGLGALGVVTKLTLQCVSRHKLIEETKVCTIEEVQSNHSHLLSSNLHVRYMWIPFTTDVVVVICNKIDEFRSSPAITTNSDLSNSKIDALSPLRSLFFELNSTHPEDIVSWSLPQLRDNLLSINPNDLTLVKAINKAEAECWKRLQGFRIGYSDEIIGFDCGGQQLVLEVAFPLRNDKNASSALSSDIIFMKELLNLIEEEGIPAASPIEQRWTSRSTAAMSPANSADETDRFSWVGIISYLPIKDSLIRSQVQRVFQNYSKILMDHMDNFGGIIHWAKVEVESESAENQRTRYKRRFGKIYEDFKHARNHLDPKKILSNKIIDAIFE